MNDSSRELLGLGAILLVVMAARYRGAYRPSTSSHGTAHWADRSDCRRAGLLGRSNGILLGRLNGEVVRVPRYTHVSCTAPTGAGKGVSYVIPTLMDYFKGSVLVFDPKFDNWAATSAHRRRRGNKIVLLDPFGQTGCPDAACLNLLDLIEVGPLMFDQSRALADAMIPKLGTEPDLHWIESGTAVLTGLIILVLLRFTGEDRNLNSVCEIAANIALFDEAAKQLIAIGGMPARMGGYMASLLDKEKSSVLSTVNRALACFASEPMARFLGKTTFDTKALLKPGTTIYCGIPVQFLDSHKGLLRAIVSSLLMQVMQHGDERRAESLYLLDECATLSGLDALAQALVLGRGKGIRLFLFWQTIDQARAAFKDKPSLVMDNCDIQLFFAVNGYETAERVSRMLGDKTITVESANEGDSRSWQECGTNNGGQFSQSSGRNYSTQGRALFKPEEVLRQSGDTVIAFVRETPPLLLRRIKYYADPLFARRGTKFLQRLCLVVMAVFVIVIAWGICSGR